jgi:hypothetical protein
VVDAEDGAVVFRSLDQPTETDIDVPPAELAGKE